MKLSKTLPTLFAMVLCLSGASAQENAGPSMRFSIDPGAFQDVETSDQLVAMLRDKMRIDMSAPDDSHLWADIRGYAGDAESSSVARFSYMLRVGLNAGESISGFSWAKAVRETHQDLIGSDTDRWNEVDMGAWKEQGAEESAWEQLVSSIDTGLARSSDDFGDLPDGKHQPLRVTNVEIREFSGAGAPVSADGISIYECCDGYTGLKGPVLMFKPEMSTGIIDPASVPVALNAVIISLEATQEPAAPAGPDAKTIARSLAAKACSGLAEGGTATLEIGDKTYRGTATIRPFRENVKLISIGALNETTAQPEWCFALAAFSSLDSAGDMPILNPRAWYASQTGLTASFMDVGDMPVWIYSESGQAQISAGQPLEISLDSQAAMTGQDANPEMVKITGTIRPVSGN